MIRREMPIVEARKKLTSLPEAFAENAEDIAVSVTRRGKPVLAIMPWEFFETLTETMEIMSDERLMGDLRKSIKELKSGKTIPWKKAREKLEL